MSSLHTMARWLTRLSIILQTSDNKKATHKGSLFSLLNNKHHIANYSLLSLVRNLYTNNITIIAFEVTNNRFRWDLTFSITEP